MTKKLLIFIIILAVLLGLYFVYDYFANSGVKAPTIKEQIQTVPEINNFQGPSGPPSVKGPSGPPPSQ
ncbi:hypothetical protein COW77_02390 [Candidatus Wolfebacteria bacterium CG18_big_fil_WC_8_21_14_2_50_39_7]|uniref:Uncharacterized protein n=3 Tax=Candidatus Wolfeibacteriota TaxID=1752735 RepID=A0A2M7Q6Z7_9BACT|nr:hypothetical protein [Parcubacteria group bacterium]NCO89568.1 hypothetical protein [Candidatus Wolfebacteria bacterium]PIP91993.1 MAG: hypothetical protein COW77_02390 [Candidatus Wolfebacteria bacterium CG18_big_fil_WC_8_21_14_2_50_39_7]PIY58959.1 MAG: hypothetical protein COY97_01470 [Candidatus Wolfebacteria bacterium CG_4_10_14_0_8_um_filter_39_64]PJB84204.1 MAG: hypothetical protein CO087_00220 [Candidatus Wolfebacteria bacterium CG_4_9_14_0_8_um_filter_39_46]